jgi:hypothetical protein
MNKDKNKIPKGMYCYKSFHNKRSICPYWSIREDKPEQENGYCSYLEKGDWETDGLLWDQVKECDINIEY